MVRENQVGGSLVKNVSVSALGADPVTTGADGQFVLHFPQRQSGDDVSIDSRFEHALAIQFYNIQS